MRERRQYRCQACGRTTARWTGQCPGCGAWDVMREEAAPPASGGRTPPQANPALVRLAEVPPTEGDRFGSGWGELDRVLGGGLVRGSVVLVGGEPGIGKSTLLLQLSAHLAAQGEPVLYVAGEESPHQIGLRAQRLRLSAGEVVILAETELETITAAIAEVRPRLVVIDSIQTLRSAELDAAAGSVGQVRDCTSRLAELARRSRVTMVLIGHVTKEGGLAGPKVTEHIVDTVLMFEGDRRETVKVLRAQKNRFGSTNEVGLFEMRQDGLVEVTQPGGFWLSRRESDCVGTAIGCTLEGSRPMFQEIQALVAPTPFAAPRRVVNGLDANRVHLILAVLEQHAGIRLASKDVYVNVVGGVRLTEPAADLAVAMAIASSAVAAPLPAGTLAFGEVGLTGEVRPVAQMERRLEEAARLGLSAAILPAGVAATRPSGLALAGVATVDQAVARLALPQPEREVG